MDGDSFAPVQILHVYSGHTGPEGTGFVKTGLFRIELVSKVPLRFRVKLEEYYGSLLVEIFVESFAKAVLYVC